MILRVINLAAVAALITSCGERHEVVVTETRAVTTRDGRSKLFATSDERFRDAKPSPVQGVAPEDWLVQPATQFRLLNYRFGESGLGEVWVSLSSGGVLENVNRWLGQLGQAKVDAAGLAAMRSVEIAGLRGVWVDAAGDYAGMGAELRRGYGLAGVLVRSGERLLSVKMVGPATEVEAAKGDLEAFAKTLKFVGGAQ